MSPGPRVIYRDAGFGKQLEHSPTEQGMLLNTQPRVYAHKRVGHSLSHGCWTVGVDREDLQRINCDSVTTKLKSSDLDISKNRWCMLKRETLPIIEDDRRQLSMRKFDD